jgi:hypothetical protein
MKRVILLVTVAVLMAAMMMATSTTAFAQADPEWGPCVHRIGHPPQAGGPDPFNPLSGCEPFLEHARGR